MESLGFTPPPFSLSINTTPFNWDDANPLTTPLTANSSVSICVSESPSDAFSPPPSLSRRYLFESPYIPAILATDSLEFCTLTQSDLTSLQMNEDKLQSFQSLLRLLNHPLYYQESKKGDHIRRIVSEFITKLPDSFFWEFEFESNIIKPDVLSKALEKALNLSPKAKYIEFISIFPNPQLLSTDSPEEIYFISEFITLVCKVDAAYPSIDDWGTRDARCKLQELFATFRADQQLAIHKSITTRQLRDIAAGTMRMIDYEARSASSSLGK